MKNNKYSPQPYKFGPSLSHGQTIKNGRLVNTGYSNCTTGIQKIVDMKRGMKRAEKVSIMSEAMIIAERVSDIE